MRYLNRHIVRNANEDYVYEEDSEYKVRIPIDHYTTPRLKFPTPQQASNLIVKKKIWTVGDRLYNLSEEHYGTSKYWWVIAWYNTKPTEAHFNLGDIVYIPTPLSNILSYYGY